MTPEPTAHTQGPWIEQRDDDGNAWMIMQANECAPLCQGEPDPRFVAFVGIQDKITPEDNANARLIAAAPELLSELKRWVSSMNRDSAPDYGYTAEKLIAKAERRTL